MTEVNLFPKVISFFFSFSKTYSFMLLLNSLRSRLMKHCSTKKTLEYLNLWLSTEQLLRSKMLFNLKQFELIVSTAHSVLLRQVRVHFLVYTLDYFYLVLLKFRDLRVTRFSVYHFYEKLVFQCKF